MNTEYLLISRSSQVMGKLCSTSWNTSEEVGDWPERYLGFGKVCVHWILSCTLHPLCFKMVLCMGGRDLSSVWSICNSSIILAGLLARFWDWFSPFSAPMAAVFSNVSQLHGLPGLVGQPYQGVSLSLFEGEAIGIQCQFSFIHNLSQKDTFLNVPTSTTII